MGPLNIIGWLVRRLLAPRLQTGEVLGDGPPRLCDVQRSGNSSGAPWERCSCQPDAQWEDTATRGLRGRQQRLCCAAFGSWGKSQQPVAERTHTAALLRHCPGCGLCQAAHPQRWGGTDVWLDESADTDNPTSKWLLFSSHEGATVNVPSNSNEEDTPLHTVARFGVPELLGLYLAHGASVDVVNSAQETALMTAVFWSYDSKEQNYSQDHQLVCRLLLDHHAGQFLDQQLNIITTLCTRKCGVPWRLCFYSTADPNLQEEDHKTALHKASWNCDHILMQMLLEAGADARAMDINGCAPIQYVLKVTGVRPMAIPELCYQLLLNYNAARIYPPQFHKVQTCGLLHCLKCW